MRLCDLDELICKTDKIFEKLVNDGNYQEAIGVSLVLKNLKSQKPTIGNCDDCKHRYENELNEYVCEILDICSDDNFYCSYFEPKESEEK